jgi:predicted metal-dependent hydrolase
MIHYKIVFSRRRSIGITIGPESGVIVRAPFRTSQKTIENLVLSKSGWIKKHLENHADHIRINQNREYTNGEFHYFGGRKYPLRIVQSDKYYVKHYEDVIEIGIKVNDKKDKVRVLLINWYKKTAAELFRIRFDEIFNKYSHYNFSPTSFAVRTMKGRWGSCTSKGRITLSTELIKIDEKYSEYVILHELCHLKHHDHSSAYYHLLSDVYPDWKTVRKELRRYVG